LILPYDAGADGEFVRQGHVGFAGGLDSAGREHQPHLVFFLFEFLMSLGNAITTPQWRMLVMASSLCADLTPL
jgi:hypothetical protein